MTQFGVINFGRMALVEFPTQAASIAAGAVNTSSPTGRTLALVGQESTPSAPTVGTTSNLLRALQEDLHGLAGSFVPVTFTDKSELNGYYVVTDASADLQNWEQEAVTLTWKTDLVRVGTDLEIDIESRLTGGIRNSSFAVSANGVRWHSPSVGHYGYFTASGNTPSSVVRIGSDGAQTVYLGLPFTGSVIPRWGCSVSNYLGGRARFIDRNSIERSGIQFTNVSTSAWTASNGLVQVVPLTSGGVFNVSNWSSGSSAFQSKNWDLQYNGASLGTALGISLLRNEPEMLVARMIWSTLGPNRITADLTLRRGSRFLELYIQSQVSGTINIVRSSAEAATSSGGGAYIFATSNDANGNRYVLGSALTNIQNLTSGGISTSASVAMDAFIGVSVGGSAAVVGDQPADLWNQYIAAPAELVQGIRR